MVTIPALPVGIPADVTVRLAVDTITLAVLDSLFEAAAGTFLTFLCGNVDRCAVPGKGKAAKVDQPILYRAFNEQPFKDIIKPFTGSHILWRMELELFHELFYSDFLHERSFLTFLIRLFWFFLRRVDRVGKIVHIGQPERALEIIKSTDTRSVANGKAGKDGMEMVLLQVSCPHCLDKLIKLQKYYGTGFQISVPFFDDS